MGQKTVESQASFPGMRVSDGAAVQVPASYLFEFQKEEDGWIYLRYICSGEEIKVLSRHGKHLKPFKY